MRQVLLLCGLLGSLPAGAAESFGEERVAVIIGANVGSEKDEPLRYAESDAVRFRQVLLELGGVGSERAILVRGGGPERVLEALVEARGRAAELSHAGGRVVFLFYFSGHGDDTALHLSNGELPLARLRAEISRIPAQLRLTFLDACRDQGRTKGVRPGPSYPLAATALPLSGSVELRAASPGEGAQESEEFGAGVFSHFLISGLRGAADASADGLVTFDELYAYAHRRTVLRTGMGSAIQHPAIMQEISGAGPLVLSRMKAASAVLELPAGAESYLVFSLPTGTVLAELEGGPVRRLAVPAGRYLVTRRQGAAAAVVEVQLAWGGSRRIDAGEFRAVAREELVRRGGALELRPWRLEPRVGLELASRGPEQTGWSVGASMSYGDGSREWALEVSYATGVVATPTLSGSFHALSATPFVAWRVFLGPIILQPGIGVCLRQGWQLLSHGDADRLSQAGMGGSQSFNYRMAGPRFSLRGGVPLAEGFTLGISASVTGFLRPQVSRGGERGLVPLGMLSLSTGIGRAF